MEIRKEKECLILKKYEIFKIIFNFLLNLESKYLNHQSNIFIITRQTIPNFNYFMLFFKALVKYPNYIIILKS
jgi:hypothetical protein